MTAKTEPVDLDLEEMEKDGVITLNEEKGTKTVVINDKGVRIPVYLPLLDDDGTGKTDQTEHVTINGEQEFLIVRGHTQEVPYNVWFVLQQKYPELRYRQ